MLKTKKMKLIIQIPAFNEEKTIGILIKKIKEVLKRLPYENKVLVINDGSIDNTAKIAVEEEVSIINHFKNEGLGIAFKHGIEFAIRENADIVVNIDADGQFNPEDIPRLISPIIKKEADMVTCTRFKEKKLIPKMPYIKKLGNKIFTNMISWLTGKKFTDTQCGFRAYSKEAILRMNLFGVHTYTQEVFLDLTNKKMRIIEIPCKVKGERDGKSRVVSSIPKYVLKSLAIIIRTVRDNEPLAFFGATALFFLIIGFIGEVILFIRWLITATMSPYRSLITVFSLFIMFGLILLVIALIADMLGRQKRTQEEILYYLKKNEHD